MAEDPVPGPDARLDRSLDHSPEAGTIFKQFEALLCQQDVFDAALQAHLQGVSSQLTSVLELIETVFELLHELGLRNHSNVYLGVKRQPHNAFPRSGVWQTCYLSGIVARDCVQVHDAVFVHGQYRKWLQCLWLVTHVREQEQIRATKTTVGAPPAHAAVYRAAVRFVLQQLEELYGSVAAQVAKHKKNNVFAGP